jgi:hypothetical protein
VKKLLVLVGAATSATAAYAVNRAREIAETEDRPLAEVLAEMPRRLARDLASLGDDLREAAEEGRRAADRAAAEFDEDIERAGGPHPRAAG